MGTTAGEVITLAGGPAARLQALLTGGYFGAWLPAETAWPAPLTHAGLRAVGGSLGAGIVVAWPAGACPLAETARVVRYLAEESAGQCGPCRFGLPALADALAALAFSGGREGAIDGIAALLPLVERRGACRHPDGVVQLVRSMIRVLDAGADGYVVKPFGCGQIEARIRAVRGRAARGDPGAAGLLTVGGLRLDPDGHEANLDGAPLDLSPRELDH